jgi:DNA-directed RNA polymerase specialized sigma24 family protein
MLPTEDGQKNTSNTTAKSSPRFNRDAANDPYYRAAINAAKTRTYRAAVSARLSPSEREDLYQEILLDLLEREAQFNPEKGSPGTFTGFVSEHSTSEFLKARKTDFQRLTFASGENVDTLEIVNISRVRLGMDRAQDAENDNNAAPISSSEVHYRPQWSDGDDDLFSNSNTLHDLETALAHMNDEQAEFFDFLASHQDLPAASKASGMSTATFYRRVDELRMHLRMFGIRPAA